MVQFSSLTPRTVKPMTGNHKRLRMLTEVFDVLQLDHIVVRLDQEHTTPRHAQHLVQACRHSTTT